MDKPWSTRLLRQARHPSKHPVSAAIARPLLRTVVLLVMMLVVTACSGGPVRISGQPPVIGLDGLAVDGQHMILTLRLINSNDQALSLNQLSLGLTLDDQPVIRSAPRVGGITIDPRSRELLQFRFAARADLVDQLQALEGGRLRNLPWRLDLIAIDSERERSLADQRGFLHAVPGQPGHFR